jgi:hypothetical protein
MRKIWKRLVAHFRVRQPDTFEAALRAVDNLDMAVAT